MAKLYDQVYVGVDGDMLAEATAIDTSLEADDQVVSTLMQEFAGLSPSPAMRMAQIENVVPNTGFEKSFEDIFLARKQITLTLLLGSSGKRCDVKGYLHKSVNLKSGVGQTTGLTLNFVGEAVPFQ